MLIDAGEDASADAVLRTLERERIDRIDYLVASHPHADHIGGMAAVLRAVDVGEVWAPDAPATTDVYEGFLDEVARQGLSIETARAGGEIVPEKEGHAVELIAPASDVHSDDMNDYSAIVKVTYGETSFLFTGDASAEEIVAANLGHVDVLKAAHHGSETGTDDAVMRETTPDAIVLSYAEGNSYGHPDQSVLDAAGRAGASVFSTAAHGEETAVSDGTRVTVTGDHAGEIVACVSAEERARQAAEAQARAEEEAAAAAAAQAEAERQRRQEAEVAAVAQAQAQPQAQQDLVVVTRTGERYHREGCRTTARSHGLVTMTRQQAEATGLTPCQVCNP